MLERSRTQLLLYSLSVPPTATLFRAAYCALTVARLTAEGSMALLERADIGMDGLADADGEPKPKVPPPAPPAAAAEDGVTRPLSKAEEGVAPPPEEEGKEYGKVDGYQSC